MGYPAKGCVTQLQPIPARICKSPRPAVFHIIEQQSMYCRRGNDDWGGFPNSVTTTHTPTHPAPGAGGSSASMTLFLQFKNKLSARIEMVRNLICWLTPTASAPQDAFSYQPWKQSLLNFLPCFHAKWMVALHSTTQILPATIWSAFVCHGQTRFMV